MSTAVFLTSVVVTGVLGLTIFACKTESFGTDSIALAAFMPPSLAYSAGKLLFNTLVSKSVLVIFFLNYFWIIKLAIGPATVAPKPPFSIITAMAIFGLSLGAKATNIEWSLSFSLLPFILA